MSEHDPVEELVRTLAPMLPAPADELHVAAMLESRGVTDLLARDEYGYYDVFALAAVVFGRLLANPVVPERRDTRRGRHRMLRVLVHGPLYALPSVVYTAVFMTLGASVMVPALVFATALGWVWGMGMGSAAHRLLGQKQDRAAARMLRLFGMTGAGLAVAGGTLLAVSGTGGPGMVAFIVAQLSYQLASGVLVFYGMETRLVLTMLPACVAGVIHLVSGYAEALTMPTVIAGALSTTLVVLAAWRATLLAGAQSGPARPAMMSRAAFGAVPGVCYAAVSALFLLFTDARYVTAQFDLAIAVAPLVLGMGAVEWRSHRFDEQAAGLLHRVRRAAEFRGEVWRLLLREVTACLLVLGGLGLVLLILLATSGVLTSRGAMLVDAHVVLGGAYFIGFVLANHGRYPWLLGIATAVAGTHVVLVISAAEHLAPYGEVPIFLLSSVILLLLLLTALRVSVGRVYHYR